MLLIKKPIFFVILLSFFFSEVKGHGDLSERIREKTIEISKNSKDAILYFERGFLYQQHNEYKKAIKDYEKSEHLGLKNKLLYFRESETYYNANMLKKALNSVDICFQYDTLDVKTYKQKAQILFKLKRYNEAIIAYKYVIENTEDLRPEDYITYSDIILAIDNENYKGAIVALDVGLKKTGNHTITIQLKKLDYLKKSNQVKDVINQYNIIIQYYERKEFWYYEKAKYLLEVEDYENSNIALQQAKLAISELALKYQNTVAIKKLQTNITNLETKLKL